MKDGQAWQEIIMQEIEQGQENYISLRRKYHQIPELSMKEYDTTQSIIFDLKQMGIDAVALNPTGVIAYLGPEGGKTIGLRADIDALAVTEDTGLPFQSQRPGCMHACGHDGHIAGLLGAARLLKKWEEKLRIRVKLIFQPSEENTQGAKKMIKDGVMDDVDMIFGLHLFPDIPYGKVSVEAGPRMAQTDRFTLTFYGKGGHAAKPHQCVDATLMAAEFVMSLQTIVSRQLNPVEGAVVTIGSLHSGTQYNIISPQAEISGTCRSFSVDTARTMMNGIKKRAQAIADIYGGDLHIDYDFGGHPPVVNDGDLSRRIREKAEKLMSTTTFAPIPALMLGDDFSWYQEKVPGVYAFVGCGKENTPLYPNHHPKFDINEKALVQAVGLHISAVLSVMDADGE